MSAKLNAMVVYTSPPVFIVKNFYVTSAFRKQYALQDSMTVTWVAKQQQPVTCVIL